MNLSSKILPGFDYFSRLVYINNSLNGIKEKICKKYVFNKILSCSYSQGEVPVKNAVNFVTFENMIEARREQAQRSYIVQVNSANSCSELYDYCNSKSPVNEMFYYMFNSNHFVLVEFKNIEGIKELCGHNNQAQPVESPFVWFKAVKDKKHSPPTARSQLPLSLANPLPSDEQLREWLSASESLSDEMEVLYTSTKLSELGIRLRMICARQVEMALSSLFSNIKALPFGSTVNSFGKEGCDLDLVLRYDSQEMDSNTKRLIYHSRNSGNITRGQTQRQMELIGDVLQIFIPGVVGVKRILGARVPIIKYSHELTGIDTDISLTNLSAVYMSELLYIFSNLDPAGLRLVFSIKAWAKSVGLTNTSPGRWITNFSLTLMCLFYLQVLKRLPSLDSLIQASGKEDIKFADDINCTFLRDLKKFKRTLKQPDSSADLLKGFFNYYQGFDFEHKSLNLCSGGVSSKPDYSPLYIVNPLERSLNVSKNVSLDEVEKFRIEARNAAWLIETKGTLKTILDRSSHSLTSKKYVSRLVAVRDLFS